jgi:Domain of unknown function (DUF4412)
MQPAKLCLAAACIVAAASTRLPAQRFEGVIQFLNYDKHSDQPDTMTQFTRGGKVRFDGLGKSGSAMIINGDSRIILMADRKQYMDMPANLGENAAAAAAAKRKGTAEKTGKTETIAGVPCADWHYRSTKDDGSTDEGEVCVAQGMGLMINQISGGMASHMFTAGGDAFAAAMAGGAGVMKVTSNGKLSLVAINVKATSVPEAIFVPPPDYTKLDMGSMRGPPRKP